jgi:methyl-accepting chemotaxis protein
MAHALRHLTMVARLRLVVGIALVALTALSWQSVRVLDEEIFEARRAKVAALVETVHGVLQAFGARERSGELSREAAQAGALAVVKGLRYEEREYFWINDLHPRMVMHPIKPALDGKDLTENKDPTGKRLFVEFVKAVKAGKDGAGFVDYRWPKPGLEEPVRKISYVKLYEPWGSSRASWPSSCPPRSGWWPAPSPAPSPPCAPSPTSSPPPWRWVASRSAPTRPA